MLNQFRSDNELREISLSIIIPVFNAGDVLQECLVAIQVSSIPPTELILVDDCSDQPLLIPKIEEFPVKVFRTERPAGAGGARNLGSEHAQGECLLFRERGDPRASCVSQASSQANASGKRPRHNSCRDLL